MSEEIYFHRDCVCGQYLSLNLQFDLETKEHVRVEAVGANTAIVLARRGMPKSYRCLICRRTYRVPGIEVVK